VSKKAYNEACNAVLPGSYCKLNVITGKGVCQQLLHGHESADFHVHTSVNPGREDTPVTCEHAVEFVALQATLLADAELELNTALESMTDAEIVDLIAVVEDEALRIGSTDVSEESDDSTESTTEEVAVVEDKEVTAAERRALLISRAKTALIVGAGLAVTGAAAYGAYTYVPSVQAFVDENADLASQKYHAMAEQATAQYVNLKTSVSTNVAPYTKYATEQYTLFTEKYTTQYFKDLVESYRPNMTLAQAQEQANAVFQSGYATLKNLFATAANVTKDE
jgi:hypothetical protein